MASSTDCIGMLSNNTSDAALVLDIISGKDKLDSTTIDRSDKSYTDLSGDLKGKKIGVIKEFMPGTSSELGIEPGVKDRVLSAIDQLTNAGATVEEVSLPSIPLSLAVYYIICPAEVSSNLARYDGQRYGFSSTDAKNLDESYELSREQGFGAEAKRRIMIGTYVLSAGYYDAYYKKAQTVRTKIINELEAAFKKYDFLIGPTSPTVAFELGDKTKRDPLQMYLTDIMTVAANITGSPAVSVPNGKSNGMPVGLQIIAPQKSDQQLLAFAKGFEELNK